MSGPGAVPPVALDRLAEPPPEGIIGIISNGGNSIPPQSLLSAPVFHAAQLNPLSTIYIPHTRARDPPPPLQRIRREQLSQPPTPFQPPTPSQPSTATASSGVRGPALPPQRFDGDPVPEDATYEQLLALDDTIVKVGVGTMLLDLLPTYTYNRTDKLQRCAVCQSKFKLGQTIKTLPCLHSYHSVCIDKWLSTNKTCPVCQARIVAFQT